MAKLVIVSGGIYLILLVLFVGGGAYTFRTFYQPPDFHVVSAGQQIDETRALIRFQEAQSGAWGLYRTFLALIGVILAVYLGVWAALFGIWKRSILKGLLALPLGGFLTILSLHPLPWLYFPFDQYPAAAVWVMGAGPLSLAVWFIAALLGRFFTPGSKPLSPA